MDFNSHIRQKRDALQKQIEEQEAYLEMNKRFLEAYDLILKHAENGKAVEPIIEEVQGLMTAVEKNGPIVTLTSSAPYSGGIGNKFLPVVKEQDVLQVLRDANGFMTTAGITNILFGSLQLDQELFSKLKFEVSAALTRLKGKHLVERNGPPKMSKWRALPTAAGQMKASFLDRMNQYMSKINPENSGSQDIP